MFSLRFASLHLASHHFVSLRLASLHTTFLLFDKCVIYSFFYSTVQPPTRGVLWPTPNVAQIKNPALAVDSPPVRPARTTTAMAVNSQRRGHSTRNNRRRRGGDLLHHAASATSSSSSSSSSWIEIASIS